jgi:hypothetical protein
MIENLSTSQYPSSKKKQISKVKNDMEDNFVDTLNMECQDNPIQMSEENVFIRKTLCKNTDLTNNKLRGHFF